MKLLGIGNPKTERGEAKGYLTGIMHLAPGDLSGHQVCPMASKGCLAACLNTAGRGHMTSIQSARIAKTRRWFEDRTAFVADLYADIEALQRKAQREDMAPAVRLNGTSDIPWERQLPALFTDFADVQFYDYTKRPGRMTPVNYHLTFSRSESNEEAARAEFDRGLNTAIVFEALPEHYDGVPVLDGTLTDLRFLDPAGHIVGLTAKGKLGRGDTTGFVVRGGRYDRPTTSLFSRT